MSIRCAWCTVTTLVFLLALLLPLLQLSSPLANVFVLAVPVAATPPAPSSDTTAEVRALQATLRHVYQLDALPEPPRTMGVHTACKKFGRACPDEYVAFLQSYKDSLPAPPHERHNRTANVTAPPTHVQRTTPNTSHAAAAPEVSSGAEKPKSHAMSTQLVTSLVADPRWNYVQFEQFENLRHLVTVLEAKLHHVTRSSAAAACALHRAARACNLTVQQQHDARPATQPRLTSQHASWGALVRCAWHHPQLRCFPAYTLPSVGLQTWVWVMRYAHTVLPWALRLCIAAVILACTARIAAWIAFGPPWPAEHVTLLQNCAESVLTKPETTTSATVQTDTSDTIPQTTTTVHDDATAVVTPATTSSSTSLSTTPAMSSRRTTAILFTLLDDHFACEAPCAFIRLRLALYLLIDLALLLTLGLIVANVYDLYSASTTRPASTPGVVRGSTLTVMHWATQAVRGAMARLAPPWLLTLGLVGFLLSYLLRLLRFTVTATIAAHGELLRFDLNTARRHEGWIDRLPS